MYIIASPLHQGNVLRVYHHPACSLSLTLRVLHPYACCLSHHFAHYYTQPLDHLSVPSSVVVVAKSLFSAGWLAGAQRAVDTKCPCPSLSQTP